MFDRTVCVLLTFHHWGLFVMLIIRNLNRISVQSWTYLFRECSISYGSPDKRRFCLTYKTLPSLILQPVLDNWREHWGNLNFVLFPSPTFLVDVYSVLIQICKLQLSRKVRRLMKRTKRSIVPSVSGYWIPLISVKCGRLFFQGDLLCLDQPQWTKEKRKSHNLDYQGAGVRPLWLVLKLNYLFAYLFSSLLFNLFSFNDFVCLGI